MGWDNYSDQCGNGLLGENFIVQGRDFIVGKAKPGYTPYTYPHPLRTGVAPGPTPASTPLPPSNLHIVQ